MFLNAFRDGWENKNRKRNWGARGGGGSFFLPDTDPRRSVPFSPRLAVLSSQGLDPGARISIRISRGLFSPRLIEV